MRIFAAGMAVALLLGGAASLVQAGEAPMSAPPLERLFGGPFSLTDQEGRARTDRDFRGRYLLLTFGYTHCPDICPTNLNAMAAALDRLGTAAAKATPVLISVDPERDTPAVLKRFLSNFGPRFVGLTGNGHARTGAGSGAALPRAHPPLPARGAGRPHVPQGGPSSLIYLIGPDGTFRTLFPIDIPPQRMAAVLRKHVGDGAKGSVLTKR